jgi:CRP-like cAMP-binding protein
MADHLRLKLEQYVRLSADDRAKLAILAQSNVRHVASRCDIIREGENPAFVHLILDGWATRHKMLEDGRRQIMAFLVPGDICDLNAFLLTQMDHSIGAVTEVAVAQIQRGYFEEVEKEYPRLARALEWDLLVQMATQREWTINLGQRSALERIAHLICELFARLNAVGLCADGCCHIPITQTDVSEATGITPVHVNRILQELRSEKLIEWKGREVHVPDMGALKRVAMFNDNYLHLNKEGAHLDANG